MTGIQFVTDDKGHKVAVLIDLKKHGVRLQDFWDGLVSERNGRTPSALCGKSSSSLNFHWFHVRPVWESILIADLCLRAPLNIVSSKSIATTS
jgi:hypothetical protein